MSAQTQKKKKAHIIVKSIHYGHRSAQNLILYDILTWVSNVSNNILQLYKVYIINNRIVHPVSEKNW